MTSKLFLSFLVLALVTEATSWGKTRRKTRRRRISCTMTNCVVSSWSSWSACSQPCGTGAMQIRTRTVTRYSSCGGSPCPHVLETKSCNQGGCANGGTPNIEGCNCRLEFSGQCCAQTEVYKMIGCYHEDGLDRAISLLEGVDDILDGDPSTRSDPIYKCYEVAKKLGFKVFGLQAGGWCASSSTAEKTFNKYGISPNCENDGEGGQNASQVYYIKDYAGVGCYRDTANRAIPTLEDTDSILDGGVSFYQKRQNAIVKCAVAARKRGFPAFALQDGGWCAASARALKTFYKYGKSSDCKNDGRGGPWANNVYVFQDEVNSVSVPDPIAFYPLNSKYTTREIKNRQPQGTPVGVSITAGLDGKAGGSYQFTGQANSYIEFPNNGGLDAQHSITMLCWVYPEKNDGPIFNYKITGYPWGVHFWMVSGKLYGAISQRNYVMFERLRSCHVVALNQWHYVGLSYDNNTGMADLWLFGHQVVQKNIGTGLSLSTQDNVRMGAIANDHRYFKGRITAMQIYDVALTKDQINEVKNAFQAVSVPDPIAFYPLNAKYATREKENRQPQGTNVGVNITAGPDGKTGGSYQFTGQANSYIEFPNNGGLDAQHSITMLCWVYPEKNDGPIFNYKITGYPWGVHFWLHSGKLYGVFTQRKYLIYAWLLSGQLLVSNQWHYVGLTYSHITGMANLWLDGQRVVQKNIGAGLSLSTQDNVRMGAVANDDRYFKGRITAMQVYDVALTKEQINAVENAGQGNNRCYEMSWEFALSRPGWANCSLGRYLSGVWRENDAVISSPDGIDNIKKGQCCIPPHEYKDNTPVCQTLDWKTSLSRNNIWASCPKGYFLQGIYRSNETWLHNIEQAFCCRPRNFKIMTKDSCYEEDVRKSLKTKGWSKCRDWHYIMGVYKGDCDKLNCIDMIKCCRMTPPDKIVLSYWLLNGQDEDISLIGSPSFTEGRCPGSKALFLNQSHSYALAPIINLDDRSFTIACWIKQTKWVFDELGAIYGDWYNPRQFLLSIKNQKIIFQRYQYGNDELELWSLESTNVTLDTWIHVAVTWDHVAGSVLIYADGKVKGARLYPRSSTFVQPTGWRYQIGKDGHWNNHQFRGSVMDLYVFGTALSLDQINKLRGVPAIVNTTEAVPGGIVVVAWEPPFEESCPVVNYTVNYRKVMSPVKKSKWHSVTVNRNTTSFTLQLNCKNEYDIAVTSLGEYWVSALNDSKIWNLKTGGDVPSPPVINNKETESLTCNVNVIWSPPADSGCPLTMYSIYHQQIQAPEMGWYQINVSNAMATNFTVTLECGRQYTIEMSAWNELGQSGRSRTWIIKTVSGSGGNDDTPSPPSVLTTAQTNFANSPAYQDGKGLSSPQLTGLVVGLSFLLIIIFMVAFSLRQKARKKKQLARNSGPRRSKSTIIPLWRWEVLPEQVVFEEEIGRGAFGKVLKGTFKESPGIEVFYKPRTQTVDFKEGRTVAIKVLGDKTDEEARNQFLEEIEIMKAIGSHKNIVSMLGCWVNSDPIFLMLEYVPYGDLQHWLRNKRIQKSYQRNYCNEGNRLILDATELHFKVDDESKALLVGDEEESKELVNCRKPALDGTNKTQENAVEELKPDVEGSTKSSQVPQNTGHDDGQQEEDFIAKDLLCFAWQIARGMNFLSSNGFVHRDLAARNVLLGEDKVVKISDFGLMRQTQESVYKLKKGKKMPVKWMAPEALYNSEYTTKSDVWSFGILLWELSTMGGNPYPGISNKELYNLLKTGYRMEKPDTCSDKLYQLVQSCWMEEPSERPTFESATRSLEEMMQEDTPYLDFESLDESKAYYCSEKLSDDDVADTIL